MSDRSIYFAADEPEKCVAELEEKSSSWFNTLVHNRYIDKLKRSWNAYHGSFFENSHEIGFGGEMGELVELAINHYRNIARHQLNMTIANRPSFQARSVNTDSKSQIQTTLANGLLEFYMREKRLEVFLKSAVEYAIVLGAGFIKMEWNATSGEVYDYIMPEGSKRSEEEEESTEEERRESIEGGAEAEKKEGESVEGSEKEAFPIYEGDVDFSVLSPLDVVFDSSKESPEKHDWVLCRTFKNKYDLAAKYPEFADEILKLRTKSDDQKYRVTMSAMDETVDIPVYEFFHKRTESMVDGRYLLYLSTDIVLMDTPIPYRKLPIYRIAPSDILGTPYGYTAMFDLLPIQDAVNSLYSTAMTNQSAYGVQNVINPMGNNVKSTHLENGMNFIEYNQQVGKPEALNLTNTPPEIFNFMGMLERAMETISGINSVARGNPESSLKSGNALALVQAQALQFISGLQNSYIQLIEDVGTGLIQMLQDFAEVPRIAEISGIANKSKMTKFKGDDIDTINRVIVDAGNSLSQCLAKDTPVLMFDGSIKMVQDLTINDKLMGPDSEHRTITSLASGKEEMFDVTSKDGNRDIKYTCNKSHILTLKYCSDDSRYNAKKGDILDISIRDYLELSERQKRLLQGFTTGVEFESKELEVPAYILGAWLGGGHSATTALTTMDDELANEWEAYAHTIGMKVRPQSNGEDNKSTTYFITSGKHSGRADRNPLMNELRAMEVINNKHIPNVYLKNDRQNRLELLAGLIDIDGTLTDQTFIFTQKKERLTDDVVYLAKSLGFKVTKKLIEKEFNGKNADIFRVTIGGNTNEIPTRLPRKKAEKVKKQKNWNNYDIKVESIGVGDYYGFSLEEEPHFLLGDFTVTHNTTAGRAQMADNLIQMGLITSPEQYFSVINTGRLETMTEGINDQLILIRSENEILMDGSSEVLAIDTDAHSLHIREHRNILNDTKTRIKDPDFLQRTLAHIQSHITALRETDPDLLAMINEQPLGPEGGSAVTPGAGMPEDIEGADAAQPMNNPEAGGPPPPTSSTGLPAPAEPARVDGGPITASEMPLGGNGQ